MYLVFDIGGTHTRLALSADGHTLDDVIHLETDPGPGGFAAFLGAVEQFSKGHKLKAAAGGLPGHPDSSGRWRHMPNLPGWAGVAVRDKLESQLGVPIRLENDAAVVGLGEAVRGAGRERAIVVYITVSTGVNGARIVGGQIDSHAHGFELGEMLLPGPDGRPVSLESLVGGAAVARKYGRSAQTIKQADVWQQEARYLAQGLFNTLLHWSPDVVVYGGPMMRDIHVDMIAAELEALPQVFEAWPPVKLAELGDNGGLYGALELIAAISRR